MPATHTLGSTAPVLQNEPAGHSWQACADSSSLLLPNRPAGHERGALLPSLQYTPSAGQSKHAVWPLAFMNLPAAHLSQLLCSNFGWTVPGLHTDGVAEPVEQNEPVGQPVQSLALVITTRAAF